MKINQCHFCESSRIRRGRYVGLSFWLLLLPTWGLILIGFPWLPVTVICNDCSVEYIAS